MMIHRFASDRTVRSMRALVGAVVSVAFACSAAHASAERGAQELPSFVDIDMLVDDNACLNDTFGFSHTDDLVVRRASEFRFSMTLSPPFDPLTFGIYITAVNTFDGMPIGEFIVVDEVNPPPGFWSAKLISTEGSPNGVTVYIKVTIPPDASIGSYDLSVTVAEIPVGLPVTKELPLPLMVLFNPWSALDKDVHLANAAERREYVLGSKGELYYGSVKWKTGALTSGKRDWDYGPFEDITLKVTNRQLQGLSGADRKSAAKVARRLTEKVAAKVDAIGPPAPHKGILLGNWSGPFTAANKPTRWTNSAEIFKAYNASGGLPVQYGQCWVFAGLLTSMSRCVGIPARPTTMYNVGWEKAVKTADTIDCIFNAANGKLIPSASDSWWTSFHVWSEARIRNDAAEPTWQACDPTYNTFVAYPAFGPVPLATIKAKTGGSYDANFFTTSVDGDMNEWERDLTVVPPTDVLDATLPETIGWFALTKKVGAAGSVDVTANYKVPEAVPLPPPDGGSSTLEVLYPEAVQAGATASWTTLVTNIESLPRLLTVARQLVVVADNGDEVSELFDQQTTMSFKPGETNSFPISIDAATYASWTGIATNLELRVRVLDVEAGATIGRERASITIMPPVLALSIATDGAPRAGATGTVGATLVNPLPVALEDARVRLVADQWTLIDGASTYEVALGTVAPGGSIFVTAPALFLREGDRLIGATMISTQLASASAVATTTIVGIGGPCPADLDGNGIVDGADLAIVLGHWGDTCACGCSLGDVDADGIVDGVDLSIVLGSWGFCP